MRRGWGILANDDYLLSGRNVVTRLPFYFVINAEMFGQVAFLGGEAVTSAHGIILNEPSFNSRNDHNPRVERVQEMERC